jgi:hypothetical protein
MPLKLILSAMMLVLSAILMNPVATTADQRVHLEQLQGGRYCGKGLVGNFVIRSKDDWKRMWRSVSGNVWPLPPMPAVDFDRQMIIAVYRRGMTLQDRVLVDQVKTRGKDYLVSVVMMTPDTKCGAARRITFPCRLVAVPRTSGKIKITTNKEYGRCYRPRGRFAVPHVGPSDAPNIPGPDLYVK